jgi:hypothetical protein
MTRREQLGALVQTMVLAESNVPASQAIVAVSMALRALDDQIPDNLMKAAAQIYEYAQDPDQNDWPIWIRENYERC